MATREDFSHLASNEADIPQYEAWIGVLGSSFAPVIAMFLLPAQFIWPMVAVAGLLFFAGLMMLIRQERKRSRRTS